jgi:hypothetical protein
MLFAVTAFSDFAGKLSAQFIARCDARFKNLFFKAMNIYFA